MCEHPVLLPFIFRVIIVHKMFQMVFTAAKILKNYFSMHLLAIFSFSLVTKMP
jgi:hypothetical protein